MNLDRVKFNEKGLVLAIVQDVKTNAVVMQAWMNRESLEQTEKTGKMTYFSRSRNQLWVKGETSGNYQYVRELRLDCDGDAILALVEQQGVACHTGKYSCFDEAIYQSGQPVESGYAVIDELFAVIEDRKAHPQEGSYTNYLFDKGLDKILKKVGEEAVEMVIAGKNESAEEVSYETADFLYHMFVMLSQLGMTPNDVFAELKNRR